MFSGGVYIVTGSTLFDVNTLGKLADEGNGDGHGDRLALDEIEQDGQQHQEDRDLKTEPVARFELRQTDRAGQIMRRMREFVEKGETDRSFEDVSGTAAQ